MAGVRQHVLPNFLLKGFASRQKGKESLAWVYHKDRHPYEANTTKIAVENKYYDGNEGVSADPGMERLESDFAPLINRIRSVEGKEEITDQGVVEFVVHMVSRTKHLRESMMHSSEYLVGQLKEYLADADNMVAMLMSKKEILLEVFNNRFPMLPIPDHMKDIFFMSLIKKTMSENIEVLRLMGQNIFHRLLISWPEISKDAHIMAIIRKDEEMSMPSFYANLRWFGASTMSPLVLGDVGCVFENSEKVAFPLPIPAKDVSNVYLPVSTNKVLVGTVSMDSPEIDVDWLNRSTIEICREFFVFHKSETMMERLRPTIGTRADMISKQQLREIVARSFQRSIQKD